jgi:hypothetical protein
MARYEDLLDEEPPAPKRGWRSFVWRHLPAVTTSLLLALLMIVVLWPNVVITVPSGRVGVLWKRFNGFDIYCWCFVGRGTLLDPRELREEGLHIIAPWDRLFIYDLRLQSSSQTINAISKDGVNVTAQMNIRYQLAHRSVACCTSSSAQNTWTRSSAPRSAARLAKSFQIHGRGGLHLARRHPGSGPQRYAEEPGQQSQQAGAT